MRLAHPAAGRCAWLARRFGTQDQVAADADADQTETDADGADGGCGLGVVACGLGGAVAAADAVSSRSPHLENARRPK